MTSSSTRCLITIFLIVLSARSFAGGPVVAQLPKDYTNIGRHVSILRDSSSSLTISQVKEMDRSRKFTPSGQSVLNLGNTKSAFWIKIVHYEKSPRPVYLVVDVPNIDRIDLYGTDSTGKTIHQHTGALDAFPTNLSSTNHYIFELAQSSKLRPATVYLRVKSNNLMFVALKMADARTLVATANYKTGFEAAYSGILIMLFIFNLFLFFSGKDKTYLYYSIYILALSVYVILYLRGYSYLFGTEPRIFINQYPHLFASIASISIFCFSWKFLNVPQLKPAIRYSHQAMFIAWTILLLVALLFGKSTVAVWVNYLTFISCAVALYSGAIAYRNGQRLAIYYFIAWSAVGMALFVALLGISRSIPYYDFSFEVGPVGTTIEMLFLSFALGGRFNQIRRDKIRVEKENHRLIRSANERLELVVRERTQKLQQTNAEKDKLFSIVAHDLRSPFNSLASIFEFNENGLLDFDELKMLLRQSKRNVDQIRLTLDNLLYWAKGQMERQHSVPKQIDLQKLLGELILVYEPLSSAAGVGLSANYSGRCQALADFNHVHLILRNLLDNAIKFSAKVSNILLDIEERDKTVDVTVANFAAQENIPRLKQLFDPGEFLTSIANARERGVGLGLHLCREYVQLNSGEISVAFNQNKVVISFSLPKPLQNNDMLTNNL